MSIRMTHIRLHHQVVGSKHVFTSPDIPELHVSHANKELAFQSIPSALEALERVKERLRERESVEQIERERISA